MNNLIESLPIRFKESPCMGNLYCLATCAVATHYCVLRPKKEDYT